VSDKTTPQKLKLAYRCYNCYNEINFEIEKPEEPPTYIFGKCACHEDEVAYYLFSRKDITEKEL